MAESFNRKEYESVQKDILDQMEVYKTEKKGDLDFIKGSLVKFYNDQYNNLKDLCCIENCNGSPEYADSAYRVYCVNHKENVEGAVSLNTKINDLRTQIENTFEKLAFLDGLISLFDIPEQEKMDEKFSELESKFKFGYKFIKDAKNISDLYSLEQETMIVLEQLEKFKKDLCQDLKLKQYLVDKMEKKQPLTEERDDVEQNRGRVYNRSIDHDENEHEDDNHKTMYNRIIFAIMFLTMGMLCFLLYSKLH